MPAAFSPGHEEANKQASPREAFIGSCQHTGSLQCPLFIAQPSAAPDRGSAIQRRPRLRGKNFCACLTGASQARARRRASGLRQTLNEKREGGDLRWQSLLPRLLPDITSSSSPLFGAASQSAPHRMRHRLIIKKKVFLAESFASSEKKVGSPNTGSRTKLHFPLPPRDCARHRSIRTYARRRRTAATF